MGSDTHCAELNKWLEHKVVGSNVKLIELSEFKIFNKISIPFVLAIESMVNKAFAL